MTKHILPVFIPHVGCPHQCVFCDQKAITGQKAPTGREVERILKEGLRLGKNPQIAFYGGSFTAIPAALQEEYLEAAFPYVQQGQAPGRGRPRGCGCPPGPTASQRKGWLF